MFKSQPINLSQSRDNGLKLYLVKFPQILLLRLVDNRKNTSNIFSHNTDVRQLGNRASCHLRRLK